MYSPFRLTCKFLHYYLTAHNGKGHGVHSPFVFDFIQHVLNDDRFFYAYQPIENLRKLMLHDNSILSVKDFGAESGINPVSQKTVSDIAKSSVRSAKYGQLLFRITDHYGSTYLLELGTSLGMTSAYLAMANPSARLTTMEGVESIATIAKENFQKLGINNIHVIEGNIDHNLSRWIEHNSKIDLALIDADHRYATTIKYFHQILECTHEYSILIFDAIHSSVEMEKVWSEIKQHPDVTLSIDLFLMGLVFFRKEFKVKQHISIRF